MLKACDTVKLYPAVGSELLLSPHTESIQRAGGALLLPTHSPSSFQLQGESIASLYPAPIIKCGQMYTLYFSTISEKS